MNRQQLMKSFNQPDEKLLFSKALDQAFLCANKYMVTYTEFLDPIKTEKFRNLITENLDIRVETFGGADGCERQMLAFVPEYEAFSHKDFPIDAVEIKMNAKFSGSLTHRDFLGTVLGAGIDRSKVGDIFIFDERAVVFIHRDMSDYLAMNLTKVKRTGVSAEKIDVELIFPPLQEFQESLITLSSMRLDGLISTVFHISRSQASKLIAADKALVNWVAVRNPEKQVSEGNLITLRGYGRVKIAELIGQSKKDKFILKVQKSR